MQYQSECRNALESAVNISKSFQKAFMDAMKLFMAIPDRINFLQMGRYGCFSEQTYRNNFENDGFDWFSFNEAIIREHLKGGRKAIAVDPSFIPKSGKVIILKIVTVCLFRETSISSHLKEIDAVRYSHEQFHCIHEYFLKRFAYIYS